jgi:ATP-binding cassette subfamily C protein
VSLFWQFVRSYPLRSGLMMGCLLLAVVAEGVGISAMLTVFVVLVDDAGGERTETSEIASVVRQSLDTLGIDTDVGSLLLLFFGFTVLQSGLVLLSRRQVGFTVAQIATDLRLLLLRSLAAARWSYYTQQPVGALASSVSNEASRASEAYLGFATILALVGQACLYGAIALTVSWQVTVAACAGGAVAMYAVRHFVTVARNVGRKRTRLMRVLLRHLTDGLQAVKPLKAMARESLLGPLVEKDAKRLNKLVRKDILAKEAVRAIQRPINAGFAAVGVFVALTYWQVPLPELAVMAILFTSTLSKLTRAQRQYQPAVAEAEAAWALREQIDRAHQHREVSTGTRQPRLTRGITLERVGLSYGEQTVLEDVSLEIPAGGITALLGPSGSGKTSLADLVCGLIHPDRGSVLVDGVTLEEIDLQAWRRTIGYVPQEVFLINDSVRENVMLGEPMSDAAVKVALQRAGAWEFVSRLPQGVHSSVGERGAQLSGGQRQRICIARALVHEPKLLILDEATTALDSETEAYIWESILRLRGELTVLAISHQPLLMSVADRIYRVEGGKVQRVEAARSAESPAAPQQ